MDDLEKRVIELERISDAQTLTINIIARWLANHIGSPKNEELRDVVNKFAVEYVLNNKNLVVNTLAQL